jgi:general secretion pathway protein A
MQGVPAGRAVFSVVLNPQLTADEFFRSALAPFGITGKEAHKGEILSKLYQFLLDAKRRDVSTVLIIDEAHRLNSELLEEIRLMANFETNTDKLLQIALVGQDELDELLDRHDLRQLKQRIAIRLRIAPLTSEQVGEYMRYRWGKVTQLSFPFDADAVDRIWRYSRGVPRIVNLLCDNSLLRVFAEGFFRVSAGVVDTVATELHLLGTPTSMAPNSDHAKSSASSARVPAAVRRWPFSLAIRPQRV